MRNKKSFTFHSATFWPVKEQTKTQKKKTFLYVFTTSSKVCFNAKPRRIFLDSIFIASFCLLFGPKNKSWNMKHLVIEENRHLSFPFSTKSREKNVQFSCLRKRIKSDRGLKYVSTPPREKWRIFNGNLISYFFKTSQESIVNYVRMSSEMADNRFIKMLLSHRFNLSLAHLLWLNYGLISANSRTQSWNIAWVVSLAAGK